MTTMEVNPRLNGHAAEQVWPSIGEGVLNLPNPITDAGAWVPAEDVWRVEAEVERLREELRRAELDRDTAREEASTLAREDRARNEAAQEWADDNDLCSQFERFCEAYGWQGRVDDVFVTVDVTVQVSVLASDVPRHEQDTYNLEQRIDDDAIREKLSEGAFSLTSTSVSDWDRV
ncbi:hypothetical protein [Gordonia sp. p3-SID1431]|uniref:hypothetical protein n=1 Tax=Gordonia sp. p3-SID1431 TaxID=2916159 RepID=UPI0021A5AEBD|nr:hypothetical protein [Gordonia sp. p3-SID1431]MCT1355226.1 hypothetical protein [Gordonia sp. p3-SID1431]